MSQITKNAIIEATIQLARTKPINKITVRNITDAAGITRNTFYYYFHDIIDVLATVVNDEMAKVSSVPTEEFDEAMFRLIEFALQYRRIWRNLYNTIGRDNLSKFISDRLHTLIINYISIRADLTSIPGQDLTIISTFYEEALLGVMMKWLLNDKVMDNPEDIAAFIRRVRILYDGSIDFLLNNSRNNPSR